MMVLSLVDVAMAVQPTGEAGGKLLTFVDGKSGWTIQIPLSERAAKDLQGKLSGLTIVEDQPA